VGKTGDVATGGGVAQKGNITIPRASFFKWLGSNTTLYVDSNILSGAVLFGANAGDGWGAIHSGGFRTTVSSSFSWTATSNSSNSADLILACDAANTLAQRNGVNAQTFRLYGTFTDASNSRRLALGMTTGGVATIKPEGLGTGASGNVLHISGLPDSNPGPGILWNDAGTVKVGT
jgi:hypothetical protein